MKIGLFHSSLHAHTETFILSKIRGLIRDGHDVRVYLANKSTEITDYPYVNPYPRRGLLFLFVSPWVMLFLFFTRTSVVMKFWRSEKAVGKSLQFCLKSIYINAHVLNVKDLNWLHFTFSTFALERENVAAAIGAKMAVSFRGFDMGIYPLQHPGCFSRLWKVVDKIHTISDDLYKLALKDGLPESIPMQRIMPAIDTSKLKIKNNLGTIKDVCSIVSIGRLEWKKGFIYALQAMHVLKERGFKFTYKIAGTGKIEEELRYAIYDLKLEDHVQLVGKLTHDEVFNFLHDADLYIQPSVQEGFCNALVEAQGTGLLCVASNAEGLAENILPENTGWIVPKRDHLALTNKIEEIIMMEYKERSRIATAAVTRVSKEFKIERLIKEFRLFYNE